MDRFRNFDWLLLSAVSLLLTISVAVIFTTTFGESGGAGDAIQQFFFAVLGFGLVAVIGVTDYRVFRRTAGALYLAALFSLVLVELIGTSALGATRWIDLGFFQFQPSEFAKIVMVIVLAKVLADNQKTLGTPRTFFKTLAYTLVPTLLVAAQPDLGTAMVFLGTWLGMIVAAGVPKRFLAGTAGALAVLIPTAWFWFLQDYQKKRVLTLVDPNADPLGAGYNVQQAQIAVGSGGFFGQTLGGGSQSQLNFLPIQHTDFIFAVIAEELIPLPFVSYGGTSILMILLAVGILQSIASARSRRTKPVFAG